MSLERESWAEGSQLLSGECVWHCQAEVSSEGQCPYYKNCHCKAVWRVQSLGRAWEGMVRPSDISGLPFVCPRDEEAQVALP